MFKDNKDQSSYSSWEDDIYVNDYNDLLEIVNKYITFDQYGVWTTFGEKIQIWLFHSYC